MNDPRAAGFLLLESGRVSRQHRGDVVLEAHLSRLARGWSAQPGVLQRAALRELGLEARVARDQQQVARTSAGSTRPAGASRHGLQRCTASSLRGLLDKTLKAYDPPLAQQLAGR
jgi:hypothetical protein